jgi:hypothetical protein
MAASLALHHRGEAGYYQHGDYIYSKEGNTAFSVSSGW